MQCPKCHYEPTMSELQKSPDDCVKCGVNYEGHARHVAAVTAQMEATRAANAERAKTPAAIVQASQQYPGAQPVVVIDINMSFGSMVIFMVKWALAAIPALAILFILFAGVSFFFGALFR